MMKSKIFFPLTVIALALSFTSCKKCKTCTAFLLGQQVDEKELCGADLDDADKPENYDESVDSGVKCE